MVYSFLLSPKDIRFIKVLYQISAIIGIVPQYNFENGTILRPFLRKIYGFILIPCLTAGVIYNIVNRLQHFKHIYTNMIWFLDSTQEFFLVFMALTLIINSSFFDQNRWAKLNNDFQELDKLLLNRSKRQNTFFKNTYLHQLLFLCVYAAIIGYRVYVWAIPLGFQVVSTTYLFNHIFLGYQFVINALIFNLAAAFTHRFDDLNQLLVHVATKSAITNSAKKTSQAIREISGQFRLLSEMVNIYNNMFGWTMIFSAGGGVVQILSCFNYVLSELKLENSDFKFGLIISNSLLALITVVKCTLVTFMCDKVVASNEKTAIICYKLQDLYGDDSKERNELLILANESRLGKAKITAANFFDINRQTLCNIIGTTTTYLIIIIQFNGTLN